MCIKNKDIDFIDEEEYEEYVMPEEIKEKITEGFLYEFRKQLFRVYKDFSLETFADDGIPSILSTGGWVAAFAKTCFLTNNEELFDYYEKLHVDDSDCFDGELSDMLTEKRFILPDADELLGKLLNINPADIVTCCDCHRYFTKDMTIVLPEDDEDYIDDWIQHRCMHCQDIKDIEKDSGEKISYYQKTMNEIKEYRKNHSSSN